MNIIGNKELMNTAKILSIKVNRMSSQEFSCYHAGFQAFTAQLPGNVKYVKQLRLPGRKRMAK